MNELYQDALKQHYQSPEGRNRKIVASHFAEGFNGLCGDEISISLDLHAIDNSIENIAFESDCCAICTASASILCKISLNLTKESLKLIYQRLHAKLKNQSLADSCLSHSHNNPLNDIQETQVLHPVSKYPARVNCALLPWQTALEAFENRCKPLLKATDNA